MTATYCESPGRLLWEDDMDHQNTTKFRRKKDLILVIFFVCVSREKNKATREIECFNEIQKKYYNTPPCARLCIPQKRILSDSRAIRNSR